MSGSPSTSAPDVDAARVRSLVGGGDGPALLVRGATVRDLKRAFTAQTGLSGRVRLYWKVREREREREREN